MFPGSKERPVPPYMNRLSKQCGILSFSQALGIHGLLRESREANYRWLKAEYRPGPSAARRLWTGLSLKSLVGEGYLS
jgi:hypothetical protein